MAGTSKIKVQSVPAESLLLAVFSQGRERDLAVQALFYQGTGPRWEGSTFITCSPPKGPPPGTITSGIQHSLSELEWGGGGYKRSDHSTELNHCGHKMQNTMEIQR